MKESEKQNQVHVVIFQTLHIPLNAKISIYLFSVIYSVIILIVINMM